MRLGWALALALCVGCASPPDTDACASISSVPRSAGHMEGDAWVFGSWRGGDLVRFPAFTTLRIEHGLGRLPRNVLVYAAFSQSGGVFAQQIGNVAEVLGSCNNVSGVTEDSVLLRNAGGEDFWVRIVVE